MARAPAVTFSAPSPLIEYVAPTLDVTCEEPAPVFAYVALAPAVTYTAPAPVIDVAPSPVIEYIAPAPFAPSQQSLPAHTIATVTTDVSLDLTSLASPAMLHHSCGGYSPLRSSVHLLPWMSLLRPRTTKHVRNRSLQSKIVYNNTQLNKLCTVPVPLIQEQIVEGFEVVPQDRFLEQTLEQIENIPFPQIVDEMLEVVGLVDEFAAHVHNRVRRDLFGAEETTQNMVEIPTVHELVTEERFSPIIDALSPLRGRPDLTVRIEDLVGQLENIELMAKRAAACPQPNPREVVPWKRG